MATQQQQQQQIHQASILGLGLASMRVAALGVACCHIRYWHRQASAAMCRCVQSRLRECTCLRYAVEWSSVAAAGLLNMNIGNAACGTSAVLRLCGCWLCYGCAVEGACRYVLNRMHVPQCILAAIFRCVQEVFTPNMHASMHAAEC
jgi:hypothetical protein